MTNPNTYERISAIIIKQIEKAQSGALGEFVMPWQQFTQHGRPENFCTGHVYRGINVLMLGIAQMEHAYSRGHWATFKQWKAKGGMVRKGEKGTPVVFFKMLDRERENANGQTEEVQIPMARLSFAFNIDQIDGIERPEIEARPDMTEQRAEVEAAIEATGADIRHGGQAAFYTPGGDYIQMPPRPLFIDTDTSSATQGYYSTLLHELTHWTGAKHRLDRTKGQRFGDSAYAFEELVAELGAAFLCADFRIEDHPRPDHAKYLANWLQGLKDEPRAFFRAASLAEKAADYVKAAGQAKPAAQPVRTPEAVPQMAFAFAAE